MPPQPTGLPADDHVHSRFSWDAVAGDMEATCERAVALGLPAISFTEHVDLTAWNAPPGGWTWPDGVRGSIDGHGRFLGAALEVDAYRESVERCRARFPGLLVRCGIELSEGHWYPDEVRDLLSRGFDRVVGSIHTLGDLREPGGHVEAATGYAQRPALEVVRAYLDEVGAMAASDAPFDVLGHVDYPLRHWPADAGPLPWAELEEQVRSVLAVLAASGRALEVNTSLPMDVRLVRWWRESGGRAVAFGSDAHSPGELARGFRDVAAAVEATGFRPAADPTALWARA
ncbi:PHP domain-containing protein [Kineococcus rubinsiae]|uniref:PHP domain-containing protein n=1 Tax=Kineococcus rubinsiae TaxID=2609562 RepID=UPI001AD945C8|nr:PHP domain-containing protein [Kineococcus rubinsiae]